MIKHDGHVHTPFCPHGSNDSLEEYVEKAMELGLYGITFTEHAPLPSNFIDPVPAQDSAMKIEQLEEYFEEVTRLKEAYRGKINILLGLEVDFIEGFEKETKNFLDSFGNKLDDSILSVHFIKKDGNYYCIDYSDDYFGDMISIFGSVDEIYQTYFQTVQKSILSDLGIYKPKRIGHITLAHKFQKRYQPSRSFAKEIMTILELIKQNHLQIDYNSAGFMKPLCQETYPPEKYVKMAYSMGIPLVYGSDAHSIAGILQGSEALVHELTFSTPTKG